ncbi:hypothetical protein ACPWT1_08220 [Ramlibacter sp. MMS24-I3-19]|uniref:hypothetical protein n=1 Tax=Ramlibacter sp. MMS24-I3-19 TaxID=3416606 RepID=UPI003D05AB89
MTTFAALPDVLIQDPATQRAFFISAAHLEAKHRCTEGDLARINGGTVTFVIPDDDFLQEAPPFKASADIETSVLIQYPTGGRSYFLSRADLDQYVCDKPMEYGSYGISFALPVGLEEIETLPISLITALQSGESGSGKGNSIAPPTSPLDWSRPRA